MSISIGSTAVAGGTFGFCLTNNGGVVGNVACGGGLSSLTIGTTPIIGGTTGNCLTVSFGVLGAASCGSGGGGGVTSINDNGGGTLAFSATTGTVLTGCTTATTSQIGCSKPDGTTLGISAGLLSIIGFPSNAFSISAGCGNSATGGSITPANPSGSINSTLVENFQNGSNYGILSTDCGKVVKLSNASAQTPTIPQANSTGFLTNWYTTACNVGAGIQTITPGGGTIAGLTSYPLGAGTVSAPNCIGIYAGSSVGTSDYGVVTGQSNIFPATIQQTTGYSAAGTPLPTCNTGAQGSFAWVSDATSPTFHSTYSSGGTVISPVFCNGTNWISI